MDDLISRQAAIDAVKKRADKARDMVGSDHPFWEGLIVALDIVEQLPSTQPEWKKGMWLEDEDNPESVKTDGYCGYCSACKEMSEYLTAYCGNCGADMRGTWNETN